MPQVLQNRPQMISTSHASTGARLVSRTGEVLSLQGITLTSEAVGGIARTILRQHFANAYPQPLEITYSFPLPADGTVAGYQVRAGERIIQGRIARRDDARAEYDAARLTGRTATLVEQERPNLFTQRLGNIPPSTDVIIELTIDHRLTWIAGGEWEWRFPTVVAPRYLGAEGTVPDRERVTVDIVDGATTPTASVSVTIADDLRAAPTSPTHKVAVTNQTVTLADNAALDRDIVIRWAAPRQVPGCTLQTMQPEVVDPGVSDSAFGLLTIVPPAISGERLPRDLVLLLDVSGSMNGKPLEHLKGVVVALIDSLADDDRLEMMAFSSRQTRYSEQPIHATAAERRKACEWIQSLTADGGTELIPAIDEALRPLRKDRPRQVVVITDGLIGFEASAIRAIRDGLPTGSRLHAVGVGSASNRAFLHPAARAGRGIEVLIDLDEPVTRGAERIVASTREPVVIDVTVEGTALEERAPRLPDLLAGSPVLASLRLRSSGGTLIVSGKTTHGRWEEHINVQVSASGQVAKSIPAVWAREAIEDLELDLACGGDRKAIDQRIEQIALRHSVSSRLTSWVATATEPSVDPRDPVRIERIPQALPYGMTAEGLGLTPLGPVMFAGGMPLSRPQSAMTLSGEGARQPREVSQTGEEVRGRQRFDVREMVNRLRAGIFKGEPQTFKGEPPTVTKRLSMRGRLIAAPGRPTATVEILVTSGLNWQPGTTAKINDRTIDIVKQGTTRPGPIVAGSVIRVELSVAPDDLKGGGDIEIDCGDSVLVVALATAD